MKIPATKQITQKTLIFALMMLVVGLAGATNSIAQNNLDPTFGNGGKVTTDISGSDFGNSVVLQRGGKIIVAGEAIVNNVRDFAIVRYNSDGKTDAAPCRDGVWYILQSTNGISIQQFGLVNNKPVPAAYLP